MMTAFCCNKMSPLAEPFTDEIIEDKISTDFPRNSNLIFDIEWIQSLGNKTNFDSEYNVKRVKIFLTIAMAIFNISGIVLQSFIIYFEKFGRDSQKRGLTNRVSIVSFSLFIFFKEFSPAHQTILSNILFKLIAAVMEWNILRSTNSIVLDISDVTVGLNSDVAYVLWFIWQWTFCGLLLSIIECCIAWYILRVVIKRLLLINDELLALWVKATNVVVSLFLIVVQSKSKRFVKNVITYSNNASPSLTQDLIIGTQIR